MIKEKIKSLVVKKDGNQKRKIENLVVFLVLLVFTLIAVNYIFTGKSKDNKETSNDKQLVIDTSTKVENSNTEESLKNILSKIQGVGKVEILITYSESSRLVPIYNENSSQTTTEETDSNGGTRVTQSYDSSKEVISNSNSEPVTEKVIMPKMEGAVILAEGASNNTVKNNIVSAVSAATGLASHKIQVFELSK